MALDYFSEKIEEAKERTPSMEHILGKGLLQPYNNTNSGPRKIMHGVHRDHVLPLLNGEKAIIETGYEIRFGDLSSSVTSTDSDYKVVRKISKFSFSPNHHYFLIVEDIHNKKLDVIERVSYHHITESYGYLYNNQYLDTINEQDIIPADTIVQKSLAFDEYNNRKDGKNFNVVYLGLDDNMEDSLIISKTASRELTSPLLKYVSVMVNENNIPVNLYGNDKIYKCWPDIGEDIKDGILISLRTEKKEETPFTESVDNLRRNFMSDEKKRLKGKVIDIDIYCNKPENLSNYHNAQFKLYYDEKQRMSAEIVSTVTRYVMEGYTISYELSKLYATSKRVVNGDQYWNKKPFSNIIIDFMVLEELPMLEGDKGSNRFGGKGVTSKVIQDELMPLFGPKKERVDIIFPMLTMNNRKNPGQVFEQHSNHVSHEICEEIKTGNYTVDQALTMVEKFLSIVSPQQYEEVHEMLSNMNMDEKMFYLDSIVKSGNIHVSTRPITDSFDIDRLAELYRAFPFVDQYDLYVVVKNSNGQYRRVKARRKVVVGKEYFFRLKQIAEEKFSATSLSATNIRGENTKSKANKNWVIMFPNTPIRFGNMEINDLNHLGVEQVVEALMIHSVSPEARKLTEALYTEDPYEINIQLDKESRNVTAEAVMTYLKAIAKRLVFKKIPKQKIAPFTIDPFEFYRDPDINPFLFIPKDDKVKPDFDANKYTEQNNEIEFGSTENCPFVWGSGNPDLNQKRAQENYRQYKDSLLTPREIYEKYKNSQED